MTPFFRSYSARHGLLRLPTEEVIAELAADLRRTKGRLHEEVLTEVIAALKWAPTLARRADADYGGARAHPSDGWRKEKPGYVPIYSRYEIAVENPHGVNRGVSRAELNGKTLPDGKTRVPLADDGLAHRVRVILG